MIKALFYFSTTCLVSLLLTPYVRRVATRYHVFANPNHRTVHKGDVPKLGGISIILSIVAGLIVVGFMDKSLFLSHIPQLASLVFGSMIILLLGTLDDKVDLNCNLKLVTEFIVASVAVYYGWRIETLVLPMIVEINLGIFSYPVSVLWMVSVINAMNLIDGLDGLASGIALGIALVSIAIAILFGNAFIVVLSVLLAGAVIGFLRYNLHPASIFLGDSGSLSIGFVLSCIAMEASAVAPGKIAVIVPLLLLGVPITDTVLAVSRRLRRGIHPFHADQEHIHHRLVRLGLSQPGAALCMISMSLILGILAFLVAQGIHTDFTIYSYIMEKFH